MLGAEPGFETQSGARTLWLTLGQHCHTRVGLGIRRARGNWAKTASGHSGHQPHPHTPGNCEAGLHVRLDARQCSPMAGLRLSESGACRPALSALLRDCGALGSSSPAPDRPARGPGYHPSRPLGEQGPSDMPAPSLWAVLPHLLGAGP